MKRLFFSFLILAVLAGCSTYSVPKAGHSVQLNITAQDVEFNDEVRGEAWALSIFPLNFFGTTALRAENYALGNTMETAFNESRSDFVFKPRTKVFYYNLLLWDYAAAEVIGKGVKLKE